MGSSEQVQSSSNPTVTGVTTTPIYKEPHILDREPHIHLATPFEKLDVLCESLVDFENMKRNGIDLTEELNKQVKIVRTEKSIAALLSMEKDGGRRIYNINPRAKYISQENNPTIFKQNAEGNPSKNKELLQNLRVWLKIILGTIHHRPTSNSSDYINTDQKCMLYCIHKGLKLCLPALLFKYLRDSLRLMEDMAINVGKPINAKNLKSMGILDKVNVRPTLDTSWDALKDQRKIPHGLYLFSKEEPRDVILFYLQGLKDEGVDISDFHLSDLPDTSPNFMSHKRGPSEKTSQAKKAKLGESSGSRPPTPLNEPSAQLQTQNLASQQPQQNPPEPEVTSPPIEQPNLTPSDIQPSDLNTFDTPPPNTSAKPRTLNLSPPTSSPLPSEPQNSLPTLEEAIMLFAGASVEKVKFMTINSGISDDPSSVRTHWNNVIGWMTSEAFKLKNLFEQARKEAEERARQEEIQRVKEAEAKALADAVAAEAEAKAAAEAEAKVVAEAKALHAEEQNALTQGESSTFVPLVLKTLEELQKEQKEVQARLDQQDTINANIQNLLTQLLQRMPPPPNP
ncbi:hypothetical protein KIW84_021087 [Lathyrus oleraceus]|uniref:Uncharacterized protein n=1 Tax=Pisum sativum TaxID=3888 RepID=A0A9D4Y7B4_PEA|nr:hypothetical protein KIW84_021087 [Pisum sativum]